MIRYSFPYTTKNNITLAEGLLCDIGFFVIINRSIKIYDHQQPAAKAIRYVIVITEFRKSLSYFQNRNIKWIDPNDDEINLSELLRDESDFRYFDPRYKFSKKRIDIKSVKGSCYIVLEYPYDKYADKLKDQTHAVFIEA